MNYIFNLESGLLRNGDVINDVSMMYRYYRDNLKHTVHILTEQLDLNAAIALALKYDLNPNGFIFVRTNFDNRSDSELLEDYVETLELTPKNTIEVYDDNNKGWWIDQGFNVVSI